MIAWGYQIERGLEMILNTVPAPVAPRACVSCVSESAGWLGMWPTRVATLCGSHYREWQDETL